MRREMKRIFIANRGEIACRLVEACRSLSLTSIVGYSVADSASRAVRLADESICIGPSDARESYLSSTQIIEAALEMNADAIHPGYGFLSENSDFVRLLMKSGVKFIGPSAAAMKKLGDKVQAKELARGCRIPLLEDITITERELNSPAAFKKLDQYLKSASFPLLVKAAGGGGGRGMRVVETRSALNDQIQAASREARNLFNDGTVFIEPYIRGARHIEVQVIADSTGDTRAIGTRDCSLQRRHQKVIEEAPAPGLSPALENRLLRAAEKICKAARYESLATVEFLLTRGKDFYFLEVNTRLQVEHPVTELSTGLDLVALQLQVAAGRKLTELLPKTRRSIVRHAIEARICAEAPELDFRSSTGPIIEASYPCAPGIRVDYGFEAGDHITHHYDSLIAKVISSGTKRSDAIGRLTQALRRTVITPPRTNLGYLLALLESPSFNSNRHTLLTAGEVLVQFSSRYPLRLTTALLAAAAARIKPECPPAYESPWSSEGNWSIAGETSSPVDMKINGRQFRVMVTRLQDKLRASVHAGDESLLPETPFFFVLNGSCWELSLEGALTAGTIIRTTPSLSTIALEGDTFAVEYLFTTEKRRSTSALSGDTLEIRAHLPGKIVSVSASPGNLVHEGTPLLVLESMKMEHTLTSPAGGTVAEVLTSPGQPVAAGDLLAVIESGGEASGKKER